MDLDDDDMYNNYYEKEGTLNDNLLRKIGIFCKRSKDYKTVIKKAENEIEIIEI